MLIYFPKCALAFDSNSISQLVYESLLLFATVWHRVFTIRFEMLFLTSVRKPT